ncbi:MAG: metal-dependent hydrolase [Methanolobus sp.]|nr:metal-dependent hydrolase [Methanolobus sp.]
MPYPPTHLLFFGFAVLIAGIFVMSGLGSEGKVRISDKGFLLVLLLAGTIGSLLPDVPAVWNLLLHGNLRHTMAGPIPSHSLLFGMILTALTLGLAYLVYRNSFRAGLLGMIVGVTFVFHLVLDDLEGGNIAYLFPLYDGHLSIFGARVLATIIRMVHVMFAG